MFFILGVLINERKLKESVLIAEAMLWLSKILNLNKKWQKSYNNIIKIFVIFWIYIDSWMCIYANK